MSPKYCAGRIKCINGTLRIILVWNINIRNNLHSYNASDVYKMIYGVDKFAKLDESLVLDA